MYTKEQWLEALNAMYSKWNTLAQDSIRRNEMQSILAHLSIWQDITVARLKAAVEHNNPIFHNWHPTLPPEPESEQQLDQINSWITKQTKDLSWEQIYQKWQTNYQKIIAYTKQVSQSDLTDQNKFAWLHGYKLSDVLQGTVEHHREHFEQLN